MIERRHLHAVRFYHDDASLCRVVASFLREGLAFGQPAVVVATPAHARGIVAELRAHGTDVAAHLESENLALLDARRTLASFMIEGSPDPERFSAAVSAMLERVRHGRRGLEVRAYGEMVDVLWKRGRDAAALQLELLWNRLARTTELALMCGYATAGFRSENSVLDICRQHTHLVDSDGSVRVSNVDSLLVSAPPNPFPSR